LVGDLPAAFTRLRRIRGKGLHEGQAGCGATRQRDLFPLQPQVTGKLANLLTSVASWAQQCLGILRLKEFDTTTPDGRSRERYRRVALTAFANAGSRGVTVATMLVAVPLTLNYLGAERYGLWMTISSVIAMMAFADLGMGLGLMNAISEAHGKDDRQAAVTYVSSGFFMLAALALFIVGAFALAYPFIPWPRLFNVKTPQAIQEAGPAMAVFLACFAANLPLGVVQRVQWGYQEGFFNNLWESAGKVLGLTGLLLVIYLKAGLLWLVLAMAGAPVLAGCATVWYYSAIGAPGCAPDYRITSAPAPEKYYIPVFFFSSCRWA
jgi:Na+-driven multidrug efflux pump